MSIWDAFGKGRYKGFSREAGQLLDKAVELAGGLGCKKADTGHLLWAMLQADGGPAARFLAGKNISELEVRRQLSAGRDGSVTRLARGDMAADLRRAMDYAIIGAQNAHLSRSICSAPCWKTPTAPPGSCWRRWASSSPRRCGSAASFQGSSSCRSSRARRRRCRGGAGPATNTAAI